MQTVVRVGGKSELPFNRVLSQQPVCVCSSSSSSSKKGKVFPYSLPSVGPGADPGVQAVSPQVT